MGRLNRPWAGPSSASASPLNGCAKDVVDSRLVASGFSRTAPKFAPTLVPSAPPDPVRSCSAPPTGTSPPTGLAIRRKTQQIGWATDAAFPLDGDHRFMDEAPVVDLAERHSQDDEVVLWWGK